VIDEEKYSSALDRHFHHTVLRIGFLVRRPDGARRARGRPSTARARSASVCSISYVRFLYIATHRALFKNELLAELLPPLEPRTARATLGSARRRFHGA
jgi:arginine N-succinyltransferase